jgi:hypothetical protein
MTLQSQLQALAATFAEQVLGAIRETSLDELGGTKAGGGRSDRADPPKSFASSGAARKAVSERSPAPKANGRLRRRSDEEIAATLNKIVLLVKTQKNGLRAEEIRQKLGLLPKEMPRILKEGVSTKKLSSKGQKRATTYFAK